MSERKKELLRATIAYLLKSGVADLSLRPLADAIGTSARLLIFHFKSKEQLLDEVLHEVHARLRSLVTAPPARPSTSPLKQFWLHATARAHLPYWRLLYEVHFIALQNPEAFAKDLKDLSISWAQIIESRLPPLLRDRRIATLVGAVFDGLMMELLTTGDVRRTTQSLDVFIVMLRTSADRGIGGLAKDATPMGKPRSQARGAVGREKGRSLE